MIYGRKRGILFFSVKPLLVVFFLLGCFLTVWLRSNITAVEYAIGDLEGEKMEVLKETKTLVAERAETLSILEVEEVAVKGLGLDFADRAKVVKVRRQGGNVPYEVSFRAKH